MGDPGGGVVGAACDESSVPWGPARSKVEASHSQSSTSLKDYDREWMEVGSVRPLVLFCFCCVGRRILERYTPTTETFLPGITCAGTPKQSKPARARR